MNKQAALTDNLTRQGAKLLGMAAKHPIVSQVDSQLKRVGFAAGGQIGAGNQGVVHAMEKRKGLRLPWQPDPSKHVLKLMNVQPDQPAIMLGLKPKGHWWGQVPVRPGMRDQNILAVPRQRVTVETPSMYKVFGRKGTLVADVMPKADPDRFNAMTGSRKVRVAEQLARKMVRRGWYSHDYKPDNIMAFKKTFGGHDYKLSDLGGLRRITPEEKRLGEDAMVHKMMTHRDFLGRAAYGRKTDTMDRMLRDKRVQLGVVGAAGVGAAGVGGAALLAAGRAAPPPIAANPDVVTPFRRPQEETMKAAARDDLPESVNHPYWHAFVNTAGGALAGGLGGAALGLVAGKGKTVARTMAAGAAVGASLGGLGGRAKAVIDHYEDRKDYERETGRELPIVMRHPYLTQFGIGSLAAVPAMAVGAANPRLAHGLSAAGSIGALGASALVHQHAKSEHRKGASLGEVALLLVSR